MKIVIQTQFRENYGAHDWDGKGECPQYWKNKGGEVYVVNNISVAEAMDPKAIIKVVAPLIEYRNEGCQEYIIDWYLHDDSDESPVCEEWETPWQLSKQDDGTYVAFREILNDEYGYFRADIASKIEQYRMVAEGCREDYDCEYKLREVA